MKNILHTISFLLCATILNAQDPHLSQFYMVPVYLNPALTGAFDGNYRLTGLFRDQWGAAIKNEAVPMYRTYTFSAEFKSSKGISPGDAFAVGASFLGDQAGEAKYGYNVAGLSIAYHKALGQYQKNYLVAGFSTQLYQQTIDYNNIQFGNQWDGNAYNSSLQAGETTSARRRYWDVNAGLLWYATQLGKNRRTNVYFGASAFHINSPAISFLGNNRVRLNRKYVVHGGVNFPLSSKIELTPKFIVMAQGNWIETVWASDVRILLGDKTNNNNFHMGGMFRMVGGDAKITAGDKKLNPESVILSAGVEWKGVNITAAYDVTVSKLITATGSKGGVEIGLSYTGKWNKHVSRTVYCPRF